MFAVLIIHARVHIVHTLGIPRKWSMKTSSPELASNFLATGNLVQKSSYEPHFSEYYPGGIENWACLENIGIHLLSNGKSDQLRGIMR